MELYAECLSGDGRVVAGKLQASNVIVRWTAIGGVEPLLSFQQYATASGASSDGSVIVGYQQGGGVFRWSESGGLESLGFPPGFDVVDPPFVSRDGAVAVGSARHSSTLADAVWRWTAQSGFQVSVVGPSLKHDVVGADASGDVIVANDHTQLYRIGQNWTYPYRPWRYGPASSIMLEDLPSHYYVGARSISADGRTIVGEAWNLNSAGHAGSNVAVRWVDAGPPEVLGTLPGYTRSAAYLVSGDGSVIAGRVPNSVFQHEGFVWIWTSTTGMRDLKQVLLDMGVVLATNVVFYRAAAISDSGEVLCGTGSVGAAFTSWVADISPGCYADCNADGLLTVADFGCFQNRFVLGDLYADCTENGQLAMDDFACFQTAFNFGCP